MVAVRLVPPPGPDDREAVARERLRSSALQLAESSPFDRVTVDAIASRAGISRRSFFRYFPTKEDVLFSDHATHLAALEWLLAYATGPRPAVIERAMLIVLDGFLDDTNFVFRRHSLISRTPALADREALWFVEYQAVTRDFLTPERPLGIDVARAAMTAAASVAALQATLLAWFNAPDAIDPQSMLVELLAGVQMGPVTANPSGDPGEDARSPRVVVIGTRLTPEEITSLIAAAEK